MSGRDNILSAIRANKPALVEYPSLFLERPHVKADELLDHFVKTLAGIGGEALKIKGYGELRALIEDKRLSGERVINTIIETGSFNDLIAPVSKASTLESVHTAFIHGTIGVAENGAVWLKESQLQNRLLPFICQHLVIAVKTENIVPTMHEAYALIDVAAEGYGVFLAGPSKTADIEQSLVIGAHGARA